MDAKTSTEILRREFKTVDKSLGLKPILIDLANEIADFIEQQEEQLEQSQDRERELNELIESYKRVNQINAEHVTHQSQLIKQHRERERVLRDSFNSLVEFCKYEANFNNGNTFNGVDEGDVLAWRFINRLKDDVKALEASK